jgi:Protein of unknown function (DUF3592)
LFDASWSQSHLQSIGSARHNSAEAMTSHHPVPPPRIVIIVVIVMSAAFLLLGGYSGRDAAMLMATGARAEAEIVDTEIRATGHKGAYVQYPVIAFKIPDGSALRTKAGNSSDLGIGEKVRIVFDPHHPSRAYLYNETSFWLVPAAFCAIGLFGLLFGFLLNSRARALTR